MSIIYDALKKVDELGKVDSGAGQEKNKKVNPKAYLMYILVVSLGFFIANLSFSLFNRPLQNKADIIPEKPKAAPQQKEPAQPFPRDLAAKPLESQNKESPPSLALNGVFFSENTGFALINNQIVKEGDNVCGATVVRIAPDSVELKFQDSTIKLKTPK